MTFANNLIAIFIANKPKERRCEFIPSKPLGDQLPLLPSRIAFFSCSIYFLHLFFGKIG